MAVTPSGMISLADFFLYILLIRNRKLRILFQEEERMKKKKEKVYFLVGACLTAALFVGCGKEKKEKNNGNTNNSRGKYRGGKYGIRCFYRRNV